MGTISIKSVMYFIVMVFTILIICYTEGLQAQTVVRADIIKNSLLTKQWLVPLPTTGILATTSGSVFTDSYIYNSVVSNTAIASSTLNNVQISSATMTNFNGSSFTLSAGQISSLTSLSGTSFSLTNGTLSNYTGSSFTLTTGSVSNVSVTNSSVVSAAITSSTMTSGIISNSTIFYQNGILTASATLSLTQENLVVSSTTMITLTLPPASSSLGKVYRLSNFTINGAIIDPNGSETICAKTAIQLNGLNDSIVIFSDGARWYDISGQNCLKTVSGIVTGSTPYLSTCSASPCTLISLFSGAITSVTRSGTAGNYFINFPNGQYSSPISCVTRGSAYGVTNNASCSGDPSTSLTQSQTACSNNATGAAIDMQFVFTCTGQR